MEKASLSAPISSLLCYLFRTPAFLRVSSRPSRVRMSVAGSSATVFVLLPPNRPASNPRGPLAAGWLDEPYTKENAALHALCSA